MPEKNIPNIRLMMKDVKLDDRTQDYVYKRVSKVEKYNGKVLEYTVEIEMDKKGKFRVEIMAKTPHQLYRTEETSESIEGSVDMAVEEIIIQITKDKDKIKELRERGARSLKKKIVLDENARF